MEQPDSLEDWVAICNNPFEDAKYRLHERLQWHVAWNNSEEKVSVTCRVYHSSYNEKKDCSWAGAFSLSQLAAINEQIALIFPQLTNYFPNYLREQYDLWSYLSKAESKDEECICRDIQKYLQNAYEICGHKLFISNFFEESTYDDCFETGNMLVKNALLKEVDNAFDRLLNVNFLRQNVSGMRDMNDVYEQEDGAITKWQHAFAELHIATIKPFIEMRELAFSKLKEAKEGLCNPRLGERPKKEFAKQFAEWNDHYTNALEQIYELYIEYYKKTSDILSGHCCLFLKFSNISFVSIMC